MIRSTGVFLDTTTLTAWLTLKHRNKMQDGILHLRDMTDEDVEPKDLPALRKWQAASAFLSRFKSAAAPLLNGQPAVLGKVWIETLPGQSAMPWIREEDDYAQAHIRTRTSLIATPENYSMSGLDRVSLGVGVVNVVEHRIFNSEINLGSHPRTHLIVDVRRPDGET